MPHRAPELPADAAGWPTRGRPAPPPPALGAIGGFRGELVVDEAGRRPFGEASGILGLLPRAVAVPRDAADVAALLRWASAERIPLVPRGAGTGMPGGNVGGGISVDLVSHFHAAPVVDAERRTARVEPGTTLSALNAAA